jgi:ATP-dependent helicase/nuclease subunit B
MTSALWVSANARARQEALQHELKEFGASDRVVLLAPSYEVGSESVRAMQRATFGLTRSTLFRFATEVAAPRLLAAGLNVATPLALEAIWARAVHRLDAEALLGRLTPISDRPGLRKALHRTVGELRLNQISIEALPLELATAYRVFSQELQLAQLADRALVYEFAAQAEGTQWNGLLFFDIPIRYTLEAAFVASLKSHRKWASAHIQDQRAVKFLSDALSTTPRTVPGSATGVVSALQERIFQPIENAAPLVLEDFFSAPGEGREAVEVVRRVFEYAKQGVAFDDMAVLLHAPEIYGQALHEAFARAQIPAWFEVNVPIPEPSGRAFLALLLCAQEGFSAKRFAEYLSLAQVPKLGGDGGPPSAPSEESFVAAIADTLVSQEVSPAHEVAREQSDAVSDSDRVVDGLLRSPFRWERLLVESSVIGSAERFERRLNGLFALKTAELSESDDVQQAKVERELNDLRALIDFALPVIRQMSDWPKANSWGEWLVRLKSLAAVTLKDPERVLSILQELAPMSAVGPVTLSEVATVLSQRLILATEPVPKRRYGQVCVAPISSARGRSFKVVFVPGLAERVFPKKIHEDPLLSDAQRASLSAHLETNQTRLEEERLQLLLAVNAAQERVVFSYPRIDGASARPRVPSFYLLEALLAVEGKLPSFGALHQRAERYGASRLAWPAPVDPLLAIDDTEFDLAMLAKSMAQPELAHGKMRYLVEVSRTASRALRTRYARWQQSRLTSADGLVRPNLAARNLLGQHQFGARAFSPTALEYFSICPYKFYLHAILRLAPIDVVEEIEELGPMEKGLMAHEIQYQLLTLLRDQHVDLNEENLPLALGRLDIVLNAVTSHYHDEFKPAIERVWLDGKETMRADLREWLRRTVLDTQWKPWRFELSFGLARRSQQDTFSAPASVEIQQGLLLRGSIDLVEQGIRGTVRATDYKTGKMRAHVDNVVGGGRHLQPMLYASVLEKLVPEKPIESGRLYYCTQSGGFSQVHTMYSESNKEKLGQVILAVRGALEQGFFPAFPQNGDCQFCNFKNICGPEEERRIKMASKDKNPELSVLKDIRKLP